MRYLTVILAIVLIGCGSQTLVIHPDDVPFQNPVVDQQGKKLENSSSAFIPWGFYNLEIARDGSGGKIIPVRNAQSDLYTYGHHINALKFLESSPCTNCVGISNIHPTQEGYVSVDISITHPFDNPVYTGFDVRGIIMFPASQTMPDPYFDPEFDGKIIDIWSNPAKGDAYLVNKEGWTKFWNPTNKYFGGYTETDFPIFYYWEGKFATGDDFGTLKKFES